MLKMRPRWSGATAETAALPRLKSIARQHKDCQCKDFLEAAQKRNLKSRSLMTLQRQSSPCNKFLAAASTTKLSNVTLIKFPCTLSFICSNYFSKSNGHPIWLNAPHNERETVIEA
eukprot:gnl/MRDRNA2_/MRDRNA2_215874_c0_seq1.p1 gnl/MRDRNA2_/MRDRNA2_215874_c0~~gnl/MRDRNA2_/MRDRNA2_215874_c0_seq1.p1  ORF type:complete len:116 (-),score=8.49 gnl/MRDRNA2_/MRDRNA2_215874_c0_seq1:33-380(-)